MDPLVGLLSSLSFLYGGDSFRHSIPIESGPHPTHPRAASASETTSVMVGCNNIPSLTFCIIYKLDLEAKNTRKMTVGEVSRIDTLRSYCALTEL